MELYALDRGFRRTDPIDMFESVIWTERFHGDGEFELVVPATDDMMTKLPKGKLVECVGSDQPMILETRDINEGILKTTGITLTQWLNNRIIRASAAHADKEWNLPLLNAQQALQWLVREMATADSSYLNGTNPMGIPTMYTSTYAIPGLHASDVALGGTLFSIAVPYGPLYDALAQIATTYDLGMKIVLDWVTESNYYLSFVTYAGDDRTSQSGSNPPILLSPEMNSFTNIRDLESITDHRNHIWVFAPNIDPAITGSPGFYSTLPAGATGFDLRVLEGFADDVQADTTAILDGLLHQKAVEESQNRQMVQLVDGEVVEVLGFKYGVDFFLGDIIQVEGNTGIRNKARITEYIRSQDAAGERAYPTLAAA